MIYSAAVTAFITTGLYIAVPWHFLPMMIAFQITLTALFYHNIRLPIFKTIISLLTAFFIILHFKQILLFCNIILLSIIGLTPNPILFSQYILSNPILDLGLPAVLFSMAFSSIIHTKKASKSLIHILFGTSLTLIMMCGYYALHGYMHADATPALFQPAGFIERGVMTIALMLLGIGIAQFMISSGKKYLATWGLVLFYITTLRWIYFDFLLLNPYWSSQQLVGATPFINGITLTYGVGCALTFWAYRNILKHQLNGIRQIYGCITFISAFTFISLTIRQYFHGTTLTQEIMSSAETYSYSIAWLLAGLVLLTFGIRLQNKHLRIAALSFITLCVVKVFLYDAAELEGLLRVLSFFGLGVSLIGLSYYYTQYILKPSQSNHHPS